MRDDVLWYAGPAANLYPDYVLILVQVLCTMPALPLAKLTICHRNATDWRPVSADAWNVEAAAALGFP